MKLKYYLRGLGIGIIVTAIVMTIANAGRGKSLTDEEIMERAEQLGMTRPKDNSGTDGSTIDHLSSEEGEESGQSDDSEKQGGDEADKPGGEAKRGEEDDSNSQGADAAASGEKGEGTASASNQKGEGAEPDEKGEGTVAASNQKGEGAAPESGEKSKGDASASNQKGEGAGADEKGEGTVAASNQKSEDVAPESSEKGVGAASASNQTGEGDTDAATAKRGNQAKHPVPAAVWIIADRVFAILHASSEGQENGKSGEDPNDVVNGSLSASNQKPKGDGSDASSSDEAKDSAASDRTGSSKDGKTSDDAESSKDGKTSDDAESSKDKKASGDTKPAKEAASSNGKDAAKENGESDQGRESTGENAQKQVNQSNGASFATIEVAKGEFSDRVSEKLKEAGVLSDASDFNRYLVTNELDGKISIGTYQIPKGASYQEIAAILCPKAEKTP